jgi:hypothetical protein
MDDTLTGATEDSSHGRGGFGQLLGRNAALVKGQTSSQDVLNQAFCTFWYVIVSDTNLNINQRCR